MFRSAPRNPRRPAANRPPRRHVPLTLDALEGRQLMAASLIANSAPVTPPIVEGQSFTAVVATFTDTDGNTDPTRYAAQITWGDGHVSKGTVAAAPGGGFDVMGTNTYAQPGPVRLTVQVGDRDGDRASASTTNIVGEAAITANGVNVSASPGQPLTNVVVAMFTDADAALRASAFSASINWGDGSTSAGKVVADPSGTGFDVTGSHTYTAAGSPQITTRVWQGTAGMTSTQFYTPVNLISDAAVPADHTDPNFVNPWGLVAPNPGDFWDSNNGSGNSAVFDSTGNASVSLPAVTIPGPGGVGQSAPTGVVFNGTTGFVVTDGTKSGKGVFLFATEDGTIAGWNPGVAGGGVAPSLHAVLAVDNSATGAVYKGLALLTIPAGTGIPAGSYLFATDFHNNKIDVFDSNFNPVTLPAGAFHDPTIPAGYAPFGIQAVNGNLVVTYAKQDADRHDDVAGAGNGFVDVYSSGGFFLQRLGGIGTQRELNSPWGVTVAPPSFGAFSNDLLVGNFGDSRVSAFDPVTGAFLGQLSDASGHPLTLNGGFHGPDNIGLWGLFAFNNGNPAGPNNQLFFASGFNDEGDGVFGSLTATTVASASATGTASVNPGVHSNGAHVSPAQFLAALSADDAPSPFWATTLTGQRNRDRG
jgi:uncharacterized protein (TIGR03118 family)